MGKYIKMFNTHSEYEAFKNSEDFIKPNVSFCKSQNEVHYNEQGYIEIGGVKWATMNVGATGVTDYGLYFQWGDTQGYRYDQVGSGEGQKYFGWADYKYGNGSSYQSASDMTKYNSTDGKTVLDTSDDAVTTAWGGSWRTPTTEEFQVLVSETTSAWTSGYNGTNVAGLVLTSTADASVNLFFPAAGYCYNGIVDSFGNCGYYWINSINTDAAHFGKHIYLNNDSFVFSSANRSHGFTLRGVLDE